MVSLFWCKDEQANKLLKVKNNVMMIKMFLFLILIAFPFSKKVSVKKEQESLFRICN